MRDMPLDAPQATASDLVSAFSRLATLGTEQVASAVQASRPLLDAYLGMLRTAAALPTATMAPMRSMVSSMMPWICSPMPDCCCEIPETTCPPYCVCEISWEGSPGEHLKATIKLTNTGKKPQAFTLEATPFEGPSGDTGATASLSPSAVNLNPNQSATIVVGFDVPATLKAGEVYTAEVKLTGQYEQCVRLTLRVRASRTPHCDVRQGEIPTRIHAHRWYHHFQCEEPCFEPAGPRPTHPGQNPDS